MRLGALGLTGPTGPPSPGVVSWLVAALDVDCSCSAGRLPQGQKGFRSDRGRPGP